MRDAFSIPVEELARLLAVEPRYAVLLAASIKRRNEVHFYSEMFRAFRLAGRDALDLHGIASLADLEAEWAASSSAAPHEWSKTDG